MLSSKSSYGVVGSIRMSLVVTMIFLLSMAASSFAQDFRLHQLQTDPEEYSVYPPSSKLEIHVIDVTRGDATLILAPNGLVILIDTGDYYGDKEGESPLMEYLRAEGITKIDVVILTHCDYFHYKGIKNLFYSGFTIGEVLVGNKSIFGTDLFISENDTLYGINLFQPGTYIDLGMGGKLINLYASGLSADGSRIQFVGASKDHDLHSIAILIDFAKFQYFTAGDLKTEGAKNVSDVELSLAGLIGDVDVLHVGAHGRSDATSKKFVSAIKPNSAVISACSGENRAPDSAVIARLRDAGAEVLQTSARSGLYVANTFCAGDMKIVVGRNKTYKINSIRKYKDEFIPKSNEAPTAVLNVSAKVGDYKSVELSTAGSSDDLKIRAYFIDWGDGSRSFVKRSRTVTHTYEDEGLYDIRMYVFDKYGVMGYASTYYLAKYVEPRLKVDAEPATRKPAPWSYLPLYITVKDPDGKPVNGAKVTAYAEWFIYSSTVSGYTNSNGEVTLKLFVATTLSGISSQIKITATANGLSGADYVTVETN